jgi:hypothetical protein
VVGGDPLADLDALRDVRLVVAHGRPHVPVGSLRGPSRNTGEGP